MSDFQLPTRDKPVKATRIGPKILILYSKPKVGKTDQLVELAKMRDMLIIDTEHGTDTYDTVKINCDNMEQIMYVPQLIEQQGWVLAAAGKTGLDKFPYTFLALDTLTQIEDMAVISATAKYKASAIGKAFEGDTVLDLPRGLGYYYLREEVKMVVKAYAAVCPYLIMIAHLNEKTITGKDEKGTTEVKVNDISLTGKLAGIISALADGIGYMYRDKKGELRLSFETHSEATMGSRQKYLAGKDLPFSWSTIYPDVFPPAEEAVKP